ncbi:tRNA N6-adenosine threonylcarbamoyltransferase, partial [Paramicrosporidium saccamoebae]
KPQPRLKEMSVAKAIRSLGRPFRVLAIETSCDDTAVSVMDSDRNILSEVNIHQYSIHAKNQGIVPHLASQEHRKILPQVIKSALSQAKLNLADIDVFAATRGPGIAGSLTVGFEAGRLLSTLYDKPFYPIHHMLGSTLDDSVGEAVDKAARILGLPYDQIDGPASLLVKAALSGNEGAHGILPSVRSNRLCASLDFSFSGLKTALKSAWDKDPEKQTESHRADLAGSFLARCSEHLSNRATTALKYLQDTCSVLSSCRLEKDLATHGYTAVRPLPQYCSDNSIMIGWAACEAIFLHKNPREYTGIIQDWPLQDLKLSSEA